MGRGEGGGGVRLILFVFFAFTSGLARASSGRDRARGRADHHVARLGVEVSGDGDDLLRVLLRAALSHSLISLPLPPPPFSLLLARSLALWTHKYGDDLPRVILLGRSQARRRHARARTHAHKRDGGFGPPPKAGIAAGHTTRPRTPRRVARPKIWTLCIGAVTAHGDSAGAGP